MATFQIESGVCHGRGFVSLDANGFLAKFYTWVTKSAATGGPGWFIIDDQSGLGSDPYIVISDTNTPTLNDYNTGQSGGPPKIIQILLPSLTAGELFIKYFLWWNISTHLGYGLWVGFKLQTGDDIDFAYDFRGGGECMIINSRLGTDWYGTIIDDFVGDSNLLEDASKIGVLQSGVVAGTSVTLQLAVGEAANFTQDNWYYIYDFDDHTWANYVQITNVNLGTDQIIVDQIRLNFPSGSVIGAYPHRMYCCGNGAIYSGNLFSRYVSHIPYCSVPASSESRSPIFNGSGPLYDSVYSVLAINYINGMSPNDDGLYAVQRLGLQEHKEPNLSSTSNYTNRGYGITKNMYITFKGSMARAQDGRIISGENWLYIFTEFEWFDSGSSTRAILIRDTESL